MEGQVDSDDGEADDAQSNQPGNQPGVITEGAVVMYREQEAQADGHQNEKREDGNGHPMMVEKNNQDVANVIYKWIVKTIPAKKS